MCVNTLKWKLRSIETSETTLKILVQKSKVLAKYTDEKLHGKSYFWAYPLPTSYNGGHYQAHVGLRIAMVAVSFGECWLQHIVWIIVMNDIFAKWSISRDLLSVKRISGGTCFQPHPLHAVSYRLPGDTNALIRRIAWCSEERHQGGR